MKITRKQLRQIIKESFSGYADERPNNPMERAYARKEQSVDTDDDGNGIPDDQEDTMDPDDKVSMILNKVRDLLEEAHRIADSAPDHQDKGEGYAMGVVESVVNTLHQNYGTEYWTRY